MPGQKIYCQGDLGAEMYFLDKGKVIITVKKYGCEKLSYTKFKKGEYFGEMAMLSYSKRAETVVVADDNYCFL